MIISHRHRFIFIKTHKTAGSAVETFLSNLCDQDDVISPMEPPAIGHKPQNWIGSSPIDNWYVSSRRARKWINRDSCLLQNHYYQHMSAERIRLKCGSEIWESYFKFCFERNPWDKLVSFYWWKMRAKPERDRESFVQWLRHKKLPIDSELYCLKGNPAVNFVGRYEHLSEDLSLALRLIGLDVPVELPKVKTGIRTDRKSYTEYFNTVDRDFVVEHFAREIALMGYQFTPCDSHPTTYTFLK